MWASYREILEYWLSQLSTVEKVGTANTSVEQLSVIVWTRQQPLEVFRNVLRCGTKMWALSAIYSREIMEYWLSQLSTVEVGTANNSAEPSSMIVGTGNQPLEVCRNVLPSRTKKWALSEISRNPGIFIGYISVVDL